LVIITAKDNDEATVIMKHDPGITKGVFKATLRPWYVVFRKHETVAPKSPATTMPTQSWTGIAASRMVGAYLQGPNIYVAFPRDRWPDDAEGKRVTVTGLPVERHDLPVFIPKEGEVQIQGIPMPEGTDLYKASARIVIEQAKWSVVSDGR
ncbi:MAG TPA: hypothetical protein VHS31_05310, partial [Tepidisphaeraceae bacterium]|nr:hypothetical protein [Tepidisphaeraceae bacterium]